MTNDIVLKRLKGAARQLSFQINVALIAGDQAAQHPAYAAVAARKFNHAIGEWSAPEVSVKSAPHL
jgi:hypothetical protein